jgi:hypothetical protein
VYNFLGLHPCTQNTSTSTFCWWLPVVRVKPTRTITSFFRIKPVSCQQVPLSSLPYNSKMPHDSTDVVNSSWNSDSSDSSDLDSLFDHSQTQSSRSDSPDVASDSDGPPPLISAQSSPWNSESELAHSHIVVTTQVSWLINHLFVLLTTE